LYLKLIYQTLDLQKNAPVNSKVMYCCTSIFHAFNTKTSC